MESADSLLDPRKGAGRIERFFDVVVGPVSSLLPINESLSYETESLANRHLCRVEVRRLVARSFNMFVEAVFIL